MIAAIAGLIGPRFAKPVFWSLVFLFVAGLIFTLGRCSTDDSTNSAQAIQTTKSGDAISAAGAVAVDTVGKSSERNAGLDAGTSETKEGINHAHTVDDIGLAVARGLCGQAGHSDDAACRVRVADPR